MTTVSVLNGAVEVGLRSLLLLVEASPRTLDLQRLVTFDYFLVHSGDIDGGPVSVHPPSPLRSGEVTVRRKLVDAGLFLYQIRGLVGQVPTETGFEYSAEVGAGAFLDVLRSEYIERLRARAEWVIATFAHLEHSDLRRTLEASLSTWMAEFALLLPEDDLA